MLRSYMEWELALALWLGCIHKLSLPHHLQLKARATFLLGPPAQYTWQLFCILPFNFYLLNNIRYVSRLDIFQLYMHPCIYKMIDKMW